VLFYTGHSKKSTSMHNPFNIDSAIANQYNENPFYTNNAQESNAYNPFYITSSSANSSSLNNTHNPLYQTAPLQSSLQYNPFSNASPYAPPLANPFDQRPTSGQYNMAPIEKLDKLVTPNGTIQLRSDSKKAASTEQSNPQVWSNSTTKPLSQFSKIDYGPAGNRSQLSNNIITSNNTINTNVTDPTRIKTQFSRNRDNNNSASSIVDYGPINTSNYATDIRMQRPSSKDIDYGPPTKPNIQLNTKSPSYDVDYGPLDRTNTQLKAKIASDRIDYGPLNRANALASNTNPISSSPSTRSTYSIMGSRTHNLNK